MGSEIVYCNTCGNRILERDFKKGRAVTILKRDYCSKCMVEVIKANKPKDAAWRPRTQRVPKADPLPSKLKMSLPFLIAIGIGVIALILLIIVVFRGG